MTALKGAKTENNINIYKHKEMAENEDEKTDQGTLERCLKNGR